MEKERLIDISVWRNQDQNENQQSHELEILQTIKFTAENSLNNGKQKVQVGDLVAAAQKRNPAKITPLTWMTLVKYYVGFLENGVPELVEDLHEFHSECVDPRDLTVSTSWFSLITPEEALKKCPQVRHFLTTTQYTKDKVKMQGAGPAMSQFLEPAQVTAWCKKTDQVNQMEKTIRNLKNTYLKILEQGMSEQQARLEVTTLIGLVLRCMFAKPWPENMVPKVTLPVGKLKRRSRPC